MTFTLRPEYRSQRAKRQADRAAATPDTLLLQALIVAIVAFVFVSVLL